MSITYPPGVKAKGNVSLAIGATKPVNPLAASLATDVALAAAGLNASCYILGKLDLTNEPTKGAAPERLCDDQEREQFGTRKSAIGTLRLVWDPTQDDTEDVNAAKALMADGAELWLYVRRGKPARTEEFVADDLYELRHIRVDGGRPGESGDDEFSEFAWLVDAVDLSPPLYGGKFVA